MKYFAHVMQPPMALIFLLLFIAGCLVLIYSIDTKTQARGDQEEAQEAVIAVNEQSDLLTTDLDEDSMLNQLAIGGPDDTDSYVPEIGDSGQELSAFVVVSEVIEDSSQCTPLEKYDAVRQVCYFTCDTKEQCDQKEQEVSDLLIEIESVYDDFAGTITESTTQDEKLKTLATYSVDEGELLVNETGNDLEKYKDIWTLFAAISPDDISDTYMQKYTVYENKESETAALVERTKQAGRQWELAVNIEAIDEQSRAQNIFLLTHEFAHILTLNENQIDTQVEESVCSGYYTDEGCATDSSYLGLFFKKFWSQADVLALGNSDFNTVNILFEQDPEKFLNEYAATNPEEDIAESFAAFIFKPKPVSQDQSKMTIAKQKVNFFYDFPELIKMRADIRGDLNIERKFERR